MNLQEQVDLAVVSKPVVLVPVPEVSLISLAPILSRCELALSSEVSLSYVDLAII